jgi:hypothetical protein
VYLFKISLIELKPLFPLARPYRAARVEQPAIRPQL